MMNQHQGAPVRKKQRIGDGQEFATANTVNNLPPAVYGNNNNTTTTNNNFSVGRNNNMTSSGSRSNITSMPTQREWRQSRQSAKFKMAMDILDNFKANHGGKLPSLRAVMKMLKVGFPKAHEILDAYAAHIGVTV